MSEWEPRRKSAIYENMTIEQMGLSTATYNALKAAGYQMVSQLMDKTVRDLLDIPKMGLVALGGIVTRMEAADQAARIAELEQRVSELEQRW